MRCLRHRSRTSRTGGQQPQPHRDQRHQGDHRRTAWRQATCRRQVPGRDRLRSIHQRQLGRRPAAEADQDQPRGRRQDLGPARHERPRRSHSVLRQHVLQQGHVQRSDPGDQGRRRPSPPLAQEGAVNAVLPDRFNRFPMQRVLPTAFATSRPQLHGRSTRSAAGIPLEYYY